MIYAHDTSDALSMAVALVNTDSAPDSLATVADLDTFVTAWPMTGARRRTRAELDAVRALRPRLREVWGADVDAAASAVNAILQEGDASPRLVAHDGWGYHIHATAPDAPLADRIAVEAAMGLADVIRAGDLDRLRTCAADRCSNVLVDLSKNRSRRFCSMSCSNRTNVAAFRSRRAGN